MKTHKNDPKPDPKYDMFRMQGHRANAISEIYTTEGEEQLPIPKDENVEFAREWVNEHQL